jgi:hypothetical protein
MRKQNLESKKDDLLRRLREAGPSGLIKGKLGIKDARSLGARALKELEKERRLANLGTSKRTQYVLIEFYQPLELACRQIEVNATKGFPARYEALDLLSRTELEKGCLGQVRKKVAEGIDWLVKERRLLKFKRGKAAYFVHATQVETLLAEGKSLTPEVGGTPVSRTVLDRDAVLSAYRRIKERLGYSNVQIYELQRELGAAMEAVKALLVDESRKGNAILSLGDWSVSSKEVRSGAIELYGKPHLLVRFRE